MRAKWVMTVVLLSVAPILHAWDVSYGNFLKITDITRAGGKLSLPVERKQYYNIRILSKSTYQWVQTCQPPCVQDVSAVQITVHEARVAQSQPDMWIVSVAFNQDWLITGLVFACSGQYEVKFPKHVQFLDASLKKRVEKKVISSLERTIK